jgi:hypothetical protein
MEEHEIAQPTTSRSSKKIWLALLDELEQELVAFQQRRDVGGTVHSDEASARMAK